MPGPELRLRQEAVSAAVKLYQDSHFSLENLAMALDCSLQDLTRSIESVDQLVVEVNSRTLDRLLASVSGDAVQAPTPQETIQRLCKVFLSHCQKHKPLIELLLQHPFAPEFTRPAWYLEQVAACFRPLENALKALAPAQSAEACARAARAIWSQVLGVFYLLYHQRLDPVGIESQEALVQYSIETFLKGWTRA